MGRGDLKPSVSSCKGSAGHSPSGRVPVSQALRGGAHGCGVRSDMSQPLFSTLAESEHPGFNQRCITLWVWG